MFATARLYLNADKSKLVHEGSEEAAFLYASPGDEIPDSAAEMFGLVDGDLPKADDVDDDVPETKGRSGSANKGRKPEGDKAVVGEANKREPGDADKAIAAFTEKGAQ